MQRNFTDLATPLILLHVLAIPDIQIQLEECAKLK